MNANQPRRGLHGKFNLPIRQNDEETQRQQQQQSNLANLDMSKMKNIDPKLIEVITSEVMDRTPPITWDDIAGLEFVKKTIMEIVIWPLLRP